MSGDELVIEQTLYDEGLHEGERIGRFLVVRDQDGCIHAVAAGAVSVMREVDDGTLLLMSGGRVLSVPRALRTMLNWLDGRGSGGST